jgi:23S rRNA (uracil1939-C5)-methyltransferase
VKEYLTAEITIKIEKLVNGGQGLGFYEGKPAFVWNSLPGETVTVKLTKKKKNFLEGIAVQIRDSSPERISPKEAHFISCSPWQIMTFGCENEWKKNIAKETFKKIGSIELSDLEIVCDQHIFGYRNKIDYSFYVDRNGAANLAFNKRGTHEKYPIDKCLLAKENINKAAIEILDQLNSEKIDRRDLKNLVLRENRKGQVVASLFVTSTNFEFLSDITNDIITGFHVYLSKLDMVKPLFSYGGNFIIEEIAGKSFKCSPLSFFQVNLDVFEKALSRIKTSIDENVEIVDFYSGVGSIGIALGDKVKSCVLVESDKETSTLANENIKINRFKNFKVYAGNAESKLSEIKKNKTIIFDPPRAGLHPKIINEILNILPDKIIYLSCDVATQARDIKMFNKNYEVKFCELYNFFPRTPHTESLAVLEIKN